MKTELQAEQRRRGEESVDFLIVRADRSSQKFMPKLVLMD